MSELFSPFSHLHNEMSRDIESKRRLKTGNAERVDYRGLVATAASRLDTININGQREYKNRINRYDEIDYLHQLIESSGGLIGCSDSLSLSLPYMTGKVVRLSNRVF